jgi:hypothetical protein
MDTPKHDYDFRSPWCTQAVILHRYCVVCDKSVVILVDADRYKRWQVAGEYVQDAFNNLNANQRELLVSGTHPVCFDTLFADEDESEDVEV